jgi:hypothetical protein
LAKLQFFLKVSFSDGQLHLISSFKTDSFSLVEAVVGVVDFVCLGRKLFESIAVFAASPCEFEQ